jgi:hypothetical protein
MTKLSPSEIPVPPIDPALGLHPLYFAIARNDTIYVKVVLESYECLGVTRTEDPFYPDDRCLVVLLLVPDFVEDARAVLAALSETMRIDFLEPSAEMVERLRHELLDDLHESER